MASKKKSNKRKIKAIRRNKLISTIAIIVSIVLMFVIGKSNTRMVELLQMLCVCLTLLKVLMWLNLKELITLEK